MKIIIGGLLLYAAVGLAGHVLIRFLERRAARERREFEERLIRKIEERKRKKLDYEIAKADICNLAQVSVNDWYERQNVVAHDQGEKGFLTH